MIIFGLLTLLWRVVSLPLRLVGRLVGAVLGR